MILRNITRIAAAAIITLASGISLAQVGDAEAEALAKLEQMTSSVNSFVADVRFDADDVESLIDLWDDFDEVGSAYEDEDDEFVDFETIMASAEYKSWASSHGLDSEDWLRKSTRITMILYREQVLEGAASMPAQMDEQLAMLEQQREQLGEEMYQQIKQSTEESFAYFGKIVELAKELPEPTAAESAVLDSYRSELMALMSEDEDDDYYEDYEDYGDEDYEDYGDDDYED